MDLAALRRRRRGLQPALLGGFTGRVVEGHDWEAILTTLGWLEYDHGRVLTSAMIAGSVELPVRTSPCSRNSGTLAPSPRSPRKMPTRELRRGDPSRNATVDQGSSAVFDWEPWSWAQHDDCVRSGRPLQQASIADHRHRRRGTVASRYQKIDRSRPLAVQYRRRPQYEKSAGMQTPSRRAAPA